MATALTPQTAASTNPANNVAPTALSLTGTNNPTLGQLKTLTPAQQSSVGITDPNKYFGNQSTTTLSSGNPTTKAPAIQAQTQQYAQGGVSTNPDNGIATSANGAAYQPYTPAQPVSAPTTAQGITSTGGYAGELYYAPGSTPPPGTALTTTSPSQDAILKNLNDQMASADAITASTIQNITNQYNSLITKQQQMNAGSDAASQGALFRSGAAQGDAYSQKAQQYEVQQGVNALADLNEKKSAAITAAQQAGQQGDLQLQERINAQIADIGKQQADAAAKVQDTIQAQKTALAAQQQKNLDAINGVLKDYVSNGGNDPQVMSAIRNATNVGDAITAAGPGLKTMTGDFADYPQYANDAKANGITPLSATDWLAKKQATDATNKSKEAYGTAFATASGKAAGEAASSGSNGNVITSVVQSPTTGVIYNPPAMIAPYVGFASNGVKYVDLSNFAGTPTEKNKAVNDAQAAGYKVITNKNSAQDVTNIQDALSKLQLIKDAFDPLAQDNAAARDTFGAALSTLSAFAQTNPDAAAIGSFQDSALDILKAMSGTQGFRGGQSIIEAVKSTFPQITDTKAVADQKIKNMEAQIKSRETALVGKPSATDQALIDSKNAATITTKWAADHKGTNEFKAANSWLQGKNADGTARNENDLYNYLKYSGQIK